MLEDYKPQLLYRSNPDLDLLPYPVLVSRKLDGIRALIPPVGQGVKSRTLKSPDNQYISRQFAKMGRLLDGLDGEIIVGDYNASAVFAKSSQFWKTHNLENRFTFFVFDDFTNPTLKFWDRYRATKPRISDLQANLPSGMQVIHLQHFWVNNRKELEAEEERAIDEGFEGLVVRCPNAPYKHNRTTLKEMNSFKLKRFVDSEAEIIGFVEELHNGNEAYTNEVGNTKRQTLQENMVPKGTLGSFIVKDIQANDNSHRFFNTTFQVGSGFDAADRLLYWHDRAQYYGKVITYKYFAHGAKDVPRHPIFKAFRDREDLLVSQ